MPSQSKKRGHPKKQSMPELVSGSGEEQNRLKISVCKRSGTDGQSKQLAAGMRHSTDQCGFTT